MSSWRRQWAMRSLIVGVYGQILPRQGTLKSACEQEHTTPQRKYLALAQVLKRSLHDDPAQRYESGAALRLALAGVAPR